MAIGQQSQAMMLEAVNKSAAFLTTLGAHGDAEDLRPSVPSVTNQVMTSWDDSALFTEAGYGL
jgi:hypothetical protein